MTILVDVQNDLGIQRIATYCPTSAEYIDLVNTAQRRMMRRGDWIGTAVPIYVCVYNGCVVWPRYVQAVRKINYCNHPVQVENLWYRFMEGVSSGCHGWFNSTLGYGPWYTGQGYLRQNGRSSVFQDIQGDGRLVRYYVRCPQDFGKSVTIFGTDNNGQPLQTNNGNGTYFMGVRIVGQSPFASTGVYVRSIDYIIRDQTQCPANLYAYNVSTGLLEDLAQYDPTETRPSYERNQLNTHSPNVQNGQNCPKGVFALVKLRYIAAQAPTDLIFIDNLDALKLMIQSIKLGEAGDRQGAKILESDAIAEMNRDIETESPDDQFAAINNTFMGGTFTNTCF